ncbi:hypothetical protein ACFY7C_19135 [Streptomyces sp. NPDC012769]|uniref:DUF7455 domain-containing protein n=1 Tax=Streptomyces sp. NPDC012769 TaxID=3364848 RepID=UPI003697122C
MTGTWPADPRGDMTPILQASIEAAKGRHPSGKEKPVSVVLTAADRCDGCGAAAGYRVAKRIPGCEVEVVSNSLLDFCVHHWRKNFPKMVDRGWIVIGVNPDVMQERP